MGRQSEQQKQGEQFRLHSQLDDSKLYKSSAICNGCANVSLRWHKYQIQILGVEISARVNSVFNPKSGKLFQKESITAA